MTIYYTGKGDKGYSSTIGGVRLDKDDLLLDLLGEIDELNSYLAVCQLYANKQPLKKYIDIIQDNLFSMSAVIANTYSKQGIGKAKMPKPDILEEGIAKFSKGLPELKKFVIPGGTISASHLHVARSIARRVERKMVSLNKKQDIYEDAIKYVNRLSSFLFVAALYMNNINGVKEKNPRYS
jgi:cob(I)alamin adenosyltransferase